MEEGRLNVIEEAGKLGRDPRLLDVIVEDLDRTIKQDYAVKVSVFLTCCSAYLPHPNNLFLRGESSTGKTYNVTEVTKYFPEEDVWLLARLSPTALIHQRGEFVDEFGNRVDFSEAPRRQDYDDTDQYKKARREWNEKLEKSYHLVDLSGRILVFLEAPAHKTFQMLLPILSHDKKRIECHITEKSGKGKLQTLRTVLSGWPATIFCTTSKKYLEDLATRCFTVSPETSREKLREANIVTGLRAAFPWEYSEELDSVKILRYYVQTLKANMKDYRGVVLPYAPYVSDVYCHEVGRDMRDLKNFFRYAEVIAALHFMQRPDLKRDEEKYLVSSLVDFTIAREIFFKIFETTRTSLPEYVVAFFHEILSKREIWEVESAMDEYNRVHNPPRTSRTIRAYFEMLADIGYVDVRPDPTDKRRNLYYPQQVEKRQNMAFFDDTIFSDSNLRERVESWLEKLRKSNVVYIEKYTDDIGTYHELQHRELDSSLINKILLHNSDLFPHFLKYISRPKPQKTPEITAEPETTANSRNSPINSMDGYV